MRLLVDASELTGHSSGLIKSDRSANSLAVRSENRPDGQESRSFVENARRAQIIDCAIETIAELGYANASLAEIARRAGISKGVISYHFAGKRELIREVIGAILNKGTAMMLPRILRERSATAMLRAYIESNLEFLGANPTSIQTLMKIGAASRDSADDPNVDFEFAFQPAVRDLEKLLKLGQRQGEFRDFSTRMMATTIRSAIDGVAFQLESDSKLDLRAYANELVTVFDLATRKTAK
jgi:TetR/AcrR family transcriptional regulator, fatty acid metabolism regulator protein